jgi:hypothetical protein
MRMSYLTASSSKHEQANPQPDSVKRIPATREVIRKFDRDTGWVATAVLVMVIFGAVGVAMQVKERHFKAGNSDNAPFSDEADQWTNQRPDNFGPPQSRGPRTARKLILSGFVCIDCGIHF